MKVSRLHLVLRSSYDNEWNCYAYYYTKITEEVVMRIISKRRISEAKKKYPDTANALDAWYRIVSKNNFTTFADLKATFPSVDKVGHVFVFNISGNKLRLIAGIHFNHQKIYIRHILAHKDYDNGRWRLNENKS